MKNCLDGQFTVHLYTLCPYQGLRITEQSLYNYVHIYAYTDIISTKTITGKLKSKYKHKLYSSFVIFHFGSNLHLFSMAKLKQIHVQILLTTFYYTLKSLTFRWPTVHGTRHCFN